MSKRAEEILRRPYSRVLVREDDGYSAEIMEFTGCVAEGDNANEAIANLDAAALTWLDIAIEQGLEIPEPFESIEVSGKFILRLPKTLHRQAIMCARREGVSLNQFVVSVLAERVGSTLSLGEIDRRIRALSTRVVGSVISRVMTSRAVASLPISVPEKSLRTSNSGTTMMLEVSNG